MEGGGVQEKSLDFAVEVVKSCQHLMREQKEFVLSRQLLRSGTSIGANVSEAQSAQSRADFISKMSIAAKEARETKYWLVLLARTGFLHERSPRQSALLVASEELVRMLVAIVKTATADKPDPPRPARVSRP